MTSNGPSLRRTIMRTGLTLMALPALLTRVASAVEKPANMDGMIKQDLLGTWKLVHATSRDPDGRELPAPYGPVGMGLVTLAPSGRMMAVLCDGRPDLPDGTIRDYASYCGNYKFDGTTLVTKVDASSAARIPIGSDQVRKVRFDGSRLVLTPPPAMINGILQHRDIFWERISTVSA
jgi:Lipocalin-like domain